MKKTICFFILLILIMSVSPLLIIKPTKQDNTAQKASKNLTEVRYDKQENNGYFYDKFTVKRKNGKVVELSREDYIFGCVAAEMPISYEKEALKAQAVAAYTFACYKKMNSNKDYDITDDYTIDQSYLDYDELKEKWGSGYEQNKNKLDEVIKETDEKLLEYGNKPILAVYHAVSSGKTYSAKEVWGSEIEYLKSVDSSYDKLSPKYISTVSVKQEDFAEKIKKETDLDYKETKSVKKINKTKNGRVESVEVGQVNIESSTLQKLFSLRSCTFDLEYKDNTYLFTVFGYGHGVGLSQNGAESMAENGSSYEEILNHYYSGCKLCSLR